MNEEFVIIDMIEITNIHNQNDEFGVAILSWLIAQLDAEMKDELSDVTMKVFMMTGKFGGQYPAIALYSDSLQFYDERYQKIETTCDRLIREKPLIDFMQFLGDENKDWTEVLSALKNLQK